MILKWVVHSLEILVLLRRVLALVAVAHILLVVLDLQRHLVDVVLPANGHRRLRQDHFRVTPGRCAECTYVLN